MYLSVCLSVSLPPSLHLSLSPRLLPYPLFLCVSGPSVCRCSSAQAPPHADALTQCECQAGDAGELSANAEHLRLCSRGSPPQHSRLGARRQRTPGRFWPGAGPDPRQSCSIVRAPLSPQTNMTKGRVGERRAVPSHTDHLQCKFGFFLYCSLPGFASFLPFKCPDILFFPPFILCSFLSFLTSFPLSIPTSSPFSFFDPLHVSAFFSLSFGSGLIRCHMSVCG